MGALDEVRQATGAPVLIHPADAAGLWHPGRWTASGRGDRVVLGDYVVEIVHTPGHTPGSVCLRFDQRALVGDSLFPGGPGHTDSPEALRQLRTSLAERVFAWPDETEFFPGHGAAGTIGGVRPAFQRFISRAMPPGACGDLEWD